MAEQEQFNLSPEEQMMMSGIQRYGQTEGARNAFGSAEYDMLAQLEEEGAVSPNLIEEINTQQEHELRPGFRGVGEDEGSPYMDLVNSVTPQTGGRSQVDDDFMRQGDGPDGPDVEGDQLGEAARQSYGYGLGGTLKGTGMRGIMGMAGAAGLGAPAGFMGKAFMGGAMNPMSVAWLMKKMISQGIDVNSMRSSLAGSLKQMGIDPYGEKASDMLSNIEEESRDDMSGVTQSRNPVTGEITTHSRGSISPTMEGFGKYSGMRGMQQESDLLDTIAQDKQMGMFDKFKTMLAYSYEDPKAKQRNIDAMNKGVAKARGMGVKESLDLDDYLGSGFMGYGKTWGAGSGGLGGDPGGGYDGGGGRGGETEGESDPSGGMGGY